MAAFISLKDSNWENFLAYTYQSLTPEAAVRYKAVPVSGFRKSDLKPDSQKEWINSYAKYWIDLTRTDSTIAVQSAVHEALQNAGKYGYVQGLISTEGNTSKVTEIILTQIKESFGEEENIKPLMDGLQNLFEISKQKKQSMQWHQRPSSLNKQCELLLQAKVEQGCSAEEFQKIAMAGFQEKCGKELLSDVKNILHETSSSVFHARMRAKLSFEKKMQKNFMEKQAAKQEEAWKILENDPHALMKFFHFCAESSGGSLESSIPEGMWEKFAQKQSEEMLATQMRQAEEAFLQFDVEEAKPSAAVAKKPAKKKKAPPSHSAALAAKGAVKPKISDSSEPVAAAAVEDSAEEKVVQALRSTLNTANVPGRLQIHPRVKRWRNQPSIEDVRAFIDSDSQGALIQKYAGCKPKDIEYLRKCHNIPVDRMIGVPDLENKYSVGYRFAGSDGGIRQGRCFYAKIDFGNDRKEAGVIRAAVNPQGQVYHIMFERRERMTLEQCTEGVAELSKPEDSLQDDDSFSQVGAYQFNVEDKGVTITIAEVPGQKPTVVKILPLN